MGRVEVGFIGITSPVTLQLYKLLGEATLKGKRGSTSVQQVSRNLLGIKPSLSMNLHAAAANSEWVMGRMPDDAL